MGTFFDGYVHKIIKTGSFFGRFKMEGLKETYEIPKLPLNLELETRAVLKQLALSHRRLAELKGLALTIPNERILISTLTLQEAQESSAVENIVTTQDELYKAELDFVQANSSTKEVLSYREAIEKGFLAVRQNQLLTNNILCEVQATLVKNRAGFRSVPGTTLKSGDGSVVYVPPQSKESIIGHMQNLEAFINDKGLSELDPLVKMAVIHHQFESIHPFYDGNGRTGRILNVLYLVTSGLLDLPILYLSRYVTRNKARYYQLLQAVRDSNSGDAAKEWENWILFMLKGVEETASETIQLVLRISELMEKFEGKLRSVFGNKYRQGLLDNLFFYPYTKIEHVERELMVRRKTASKYLGMIVDAGLLRKEKVGNVNYYINEDLVELFVSRPSQSGSPAVETVEVSP